MWSLKQIGSSLFMISTLLWLTVSTPFVYACQRTQSALEQQANSNDNNPFANTTEEKSETGSTNISEYRHDAESMQHHFIVITTLYKCHCCPIHYEFYPELQSPPPEA